MIKVVITDDHKVVINGLVGMLEHYPQIAVMDTYETGTALLEGLKKGAPDGLPDVLMLDIQIPDIQGDELAEMVTEQYRGISILAMTVFDTSFYVKTMLEKGALGYLLKNTDKEILVEAI